MTAAWPACNYVQCGEGVNGMEIFSVSYSVFLTDCLQRGVNMTDTEKLDLILARLDWLGDEIQDAKKDINALKRQAMKSTAELKAMDEMILDEVERVHGILERHKEDKSVHTA